jgi:DNA polymerase III subunit epsilon
MDFTAIDFETANHRRDSACQLAAVVVRGGKVVDQHMWMIKPKPFYFSARNIDVHGIRPHQVEQERDFGELWEVISPHLCDGCLIAHNASFDLGVLRECIKTHGHHVPAFHFNCTRLIARAAWPGRSGYGLKPIASWLGIQFRHHDALEDSLACAKILLEAASAFRAQTLEQLESLLSLRRGYADADVYRGAAKSTRRSKTSSTSTQKSPLLRESVSAYERAAPAKSMATFIDPPTLEPPAIDLQRLLIRADFNKRLSNKRIVFTGELQCFSRESAVRLATRLGATVSDKVTAETDMLVIGCNDAKQFANCCTITCEEAAANELQSQGHRIQQISETDFLGLIQCPAPHPR